MNTDTMLSTNQTASKLGVRPQTLRKWRLLGKGPRYVRLGESSRSRVAYDTDDVQEWIDSRTFRSTSEETAKLARVSPPRENEQCA